MSVGDSTPRGGEVPHVEMRDFPTGSQGRPDEGPGRLGRRAQAAAEPPWRPRSAAVSSASLRPRCSRPLRARVRSEIVCRRGVQRADRPGEAQDLPVDQPLVELVEVQQLRLGSRTRLQQVGRQRAHRNRPESASVERRALAEEKAPRGVDVASP